MFNFTRNLFGQKETTSYGYTSEHSNKWDNLSHTIEKGRRAREKRERKMPTPEGTENRGGSMVPKLRCNHTHPIPPPRNPIRAVGDKPLPQIPSSNSAVCSHPSPNIAPILATRKPHMHNTRNKTFFRRFALAWKRITIQSRRFLGKSKTANEVTKDMSLPKGFVLVEPRTTSWRRHSSKRKRESKSPQTNLYRHRG